MPHLILNYTSNIDPPLDFGSLFLKLHTILNSIAGIEINNCKSRAQKLENYFISRGESEKAFIHLDVNFLEGRSAKIKKKIGNLCLDTIKEYCTSYLTKKDLQITVEIRDIRKEFYFKYPGSLPSAK